MSTVTVAPVRIGAGAPSTQRDNGANDEVLDEVGRRAAAAAGNIDAALDAAQQLAPLLPGPGSGSTTQLWEAMATMAAADVSVARVAEPHLDAISILGQCPSFDPAGGDGPATGSGMPAGSWGVFAAEGQGTRLRAVRMDGGWQLTGRKPWCSLGSKLTHAIVTAHVSDASRRAFAVDLRENGVSVPESGWISRGLRQVESGPIDFDNVTATAIGGDDWYLNRPGFSWGAIGVAACWYGAAVAVGRRLYRGCLDRTPDQLATSYLGSVDTALHTARTALSAAALAVDGGTATGREGVLLAQRTRNIVHRAAETVIAATAHNLGPAPLTFEEEHARRVADLQIYLRQHHGARDHAALGQSILSGSGSEAPW